jgi:threonyl-tRNA synthetase
VQVTIGPWTDRGFFYDFDMPAPLTEQDLPQIRKEMQRILKKNLPFVREEVTPDEARRRIQVRQHAPGSRTHLHRCTVIWAG